MQINCERFTVEGGINCKKFALEGRQFAGEAKEKGTSLLSKPPPEIR